MMDDLRYTLVAEGSSDRVLMPILDWLLEENGVHIAIQGEFSDTSVKTLGAKIRKAVQSYPCDLLFVHRDADRETRDKRVEEIETAIADANLPSLRPYVCVIPVRMQEAWLLFDEAAIRYAADNSNGTMLLSLPPLNRLESLPNPKQELTDLLKTASGKSGRNLKKFRPNQKMHRITEIIDDFSPLRQLTAFQALENEIKQFVADWTGEKNG